MHYESMILRARHATDWMWGRIQTSGRALRSWTCTRPRRRDLARIAMFSMRCKNAKAFATMTVQRACSNATLSIMPVCGLPLLSTAPRHLCMLANRPAPSPTCQPALATAILTHPRRRTKESLCSHGTCGITDNEPCRCQRRVRCHRRMPCLEGG
ncbi:hypothetical protein B0H14DRAFT_500376 [Mycena olivaceomarginata]|nr:hypothetical protein B0H14DRAFT_500376 [Mycena olivaceomarginata]